MPVGEPTVSRSASAGPDAVGVSGASDLLAQLTVAPERPRTGYKRDLFPDWLDADHDGCNTRAEVLLVESLVETRLDMGCKITSGRWLSVYDGMTIETPSSLDIDHVVSVPVALLLA
jgi:hypothetical protein